MEMVLRFSKRWMEAFYFTELESSDITSGYMNYGRNPSLHLAEHYAMCQLFIEIRLFMGVNEVDLDPVQNHRTLEPGESLGQKFLGSQSRPKTSWAENLLSRKSEPKISWAESPGRKFRGPKVRAANSVGRKFGLPLHRSYRICG